MLYMLDTNICIYTMKKKPIAYFQKLEELIQSHHTIALSAIVLSELQYGVANSQHQEDNQIALNTFLGHLDVLPYTDKCGFFYGELRCQLKRKGTLIGNNDMLIAAHALTESAILVTHNSQEFSRIRHLKIEDWR